MGNDAADGVSQGGFARSGRSDDSEKGSVRDGEADVAESVPVRALIPEGEGLYFDHDPYSFSVLG